MKRFLTPAGVFLGIVLGFAACCVLGRQLPKLLPMQGFQRLHHYLNPQSLYFPTALQIRALARHELPPDKIAVIVSGNSVMQGSGQAVQDVWTKHLQQELGDEYRILNLAAPSGAPNEFGQVAAEILCAGRRRVIHVCNCNPSYFSVSPDGTPAYRYIFHDAQARGLLLPFPERDAALAAMASNRRVDGAYDELLLQAQANRWLSFNDLWQVLGYEACFTVWNKTCCGQQWRPRKLVPDPGGSTSAVQGAFFGWAQARGLLLTQTAPNAPEQWQWYTGLVLQSVPEPLRPRTLPVVIRHNPAYVAKLALEEPDFPARYDGKVQQAVQQLRRCGLRAVSVGAAMVPSDFIDSRHLRASGGVKLAHDLAPAIRAMARDLGYVHGD